MAPKCNVYFEKGAQAALIAGMTPQDLAACNIYRIQHGMHPYPSAPGPGMGGKRSTRKASRKGSRKNRRKNRKGSRKNRKASRKNRKGSRKNRSIMSGGLNASCAYDSKCPKAPAGSDKHNWSMMGIGEHMCTNCGCYISDH